MKRFIILIFSIFLLSGCYNYNDLENIDIVSSISIDYKDEYKVNIEVINDEKSSYYSGNGSTISECFEVIKLEAPNELHLSHLNIVAFTKNVDLKELINYFLRSPKVNNTFYFIFTDDIDNKINGDKLFKILKNQNVYNFFNIVKRLNSDISILIPYLKDNSINSGYLFSNYESKKEIDYETVEVYKLLDNIDNSYFNISDISFETNNVSTVISYSDTFNLYINFNINILENNSKFKLDNDNDVLLLESIINKNLENKIYNFINILKENNSDIFGFNNILKNKYHNDNYKFYDKDFNIVVSGHISKKGLLTR